MTWQFADAKNRFSEVVNRASTEGSQVISRRKDGRTDHYVLMTEGEYQRLTGKQMGFKEFLLQPIGLEELDLRRDQSLMRDVEL